MSLQTKHTLLFVALFLIAIVVSDMANAQDIPKRKNRQKPQQEFRWVNPVKGKLPTNVQQLTFRSKSMDIDVGYCIYLPSAYSWKKDSEKRFPVVYYLHGGRPGSETKSIKLVEKFHANIESGKVAPMIYVLVNGGPVSHYNMPERKNAMGEDVFVKELIPHIDKTFRTVADRSGRAIEGFSQGGRGTARIMFKHPELFCSAAPGGGGYATEKRISEEKGFENPNLKFGEGYNTWDLAREYAKKIESDTPPPALKIQFHVGTKGFNHDNNLEYMKFLDSLKIDFERVIVENATHSAAQIYDAKGVEIMSFHAGNFANSK